MSLHPLYSEETEGTQQSQLRTTTAITVKH